MPKKNSKNHRKQQKNMLIFAYFRVMVRDMKKSMSYTVFEISRDLKMNTKLIGLSSKLG